MDRLHVLYVVYIVFIFIIVILLNLHISDKNSGGGSTHSEGGRILKNSPPPKPKAISLDRTDVFATVLFTEFLKELAAIAQEHSILSYIPMED